MHQQTHRALHALPWLEKLLCMHMYEGVSGPEVSLARLPTYRAYLLVVACPGQTAQLWVSRRRALLRIVTGAKKPKGSKTLFTVERTPRRVNGLMSFATEKVNVSLAISHRRPRLRWISAASPLKSTSFTNDAQFFGWESCQDFFAVGSKLVKPEVRFSKWSLCSA